MNLRRAGTYLCVATLLTTAIATSSLRAQDESDSPPPRLRGGIVHQLRSLTEDAKNVLDNARQRTSTGASVNAPPRVSRPPRSRSAPSRPAQVENAPVELPPQPTGRSTLQRTHASPWVERQQLSRSQPALPSQPLPEVVRPEEILANQQQVASKQKAGKLEQVGGESLVHVESQIPQAVRDSFRPPAQRTQQRSNAPRPRTDLTSGQSTTRSELSPEPATLQTPRVSRVPLPKRPSTTSISGENRLQPQSPDPKSLSIQAPSQPAPSQRVATPSGSSPTTKINTRDSASEVENALPDGVTVPTQVARVPTMERSSAPASQNAPALGELPSSLQTPASEQLPALPDQASQNLPSLPSQSAAPPASLPPSLPSFGPTQQTPSQPGLNTASSSAAAVGLHASPTLPRNATPTNEKPLNETQPNVTPSNETLANETPSNKFQTVNTEPSITGSSDTTRMSMITPRVRVQLIGPSDIPVAKPATYQIVVNNQDKIDLNGLLLQLDVPAGIKVQSMGPSMGNVDVESAGDGSTLLSWTFEKLPAGQEAIAPLQLVASAAQNFAVAMEWTLLPVADLARVAVRSPRLELALEGPSQVDYGKANTYRLVIRNPGNAPATDVTVALTAEQYGNSSSQIGDIPAGGEESIDVELTFNQKGTINIAAAATAGGGLSSQTAIDVLVRKANLQTSIVSPTLVYHGSATPVVVTVANTGNTTAEQVKASLALPSGAKLQNVPPYVVRVGDEARWTIAKLAAGESQEIPMGVTFTQSGDNTLVLDCSDNAGLTSRASSTTLVEAVADLILLVNDPPAPAPIGSEVAYILKLTNRGSKAAKDVKVITQFSDGIEPARGVGMEYKVVPGQLFFEPIDSIAAGETIELKVYAKAQTSGMHRFRAEVRTSEEAMRLVQEEATRFMDSVRHIASPPSGSVIR